MKPGYRTTEYWLSVAALVVGALLASGAFSDTPAALKVLGAASSILAALGYTASRTFAKGAETKAAALVEAAKAAPPADPR